MNNIVFNGLDIEHIYKTNLKNSYITIKPSKEGSLRTKVILKTPKVPQSYILCLLEEKEPWIRKQLKKFEQNPPTIINLEDEVLLFGEIYSIDSLEAKKLRESICKVEVSNKQSVLKCYDDFYKHYAKEYILPRVSYFSNLMGLSYSDVKFKKLKSRWGSCSSNGVITLNTELMKVKKELIDYVIVHELAHLVHMNHSKSFHSLVDKYIKNSSALRKSLKNTHLIME